MAGIIEVSLKNGIKPIHTFDEAITLTGQGKFHWILLLTVGCALLGVSSEGMSMSFVLPVAKCELHISNVEQGMINAVAFAGVVLTSHFWGFMADTWGRVKVLRCSLLVGFLCSTLSSFSVNSTMLLVTRFMVGLSISGVQAASISYLGEFHSDKARGKWVSLAIMFMPFAVIYQPAMGLFVMPRSWGFTIFGMLYGTWRIYIMFSSSILAFAFVSTMLLPESPKFLLAMDRKAEALDALAGIFRSNTGRALKEYPVREIELGAQGTRLGDAKGFSGTFKLLWRQTYPIFMPPYLSNMVLLFYVSIASYVSSHGFYMWSPQILAFYLPRKDQSITVCQAVHDGIAQIVRESKSINETLVSLDDPIACTSGTYDETTFYIIMMMGVVFSLLYLLFAVVKCSMKFICSVWLVVCAFCAVAMFWTQNFYLNVVLMTLMMSSGNCGGILSALAADLFPTHYKGMALCLILMSGRIGAIVGSNIVASMLEDLCEWIFVVNASLLIVAGILVFVIINRIEFKRKLESSA